MNPIMNERQDVYTKITNRIIEALEQGTRPWMQPWNAAHAAGRISRPLRATGETYKGINVLVLWSAAADAGYSAPIWMTYKQAQEQGGQVRKGERGEFVMYANTVTKTEQDDDTGEDVEKAVPILKRYSVFNVEQIDGLPERFYELAAPVLDTLERIEHAEAFFTATGATIKHQGGQACYSVTHDEIRMPPFETFKSPEDYYATLAHEATHWTRHPSRLARDFGRKRWGDAGYAMEELVAELGSAFLAADLGLELEPREDHAAYLASWLEVLKHDKRAIFTAASHASRAADYLHGQAEHHQEVAA